MSLLARFKRDIAKHRGRSAMLGTLFVGFVAAVVKMVSDLHGPAMAVASTHLTDPAAETTKLPMTSAEAEARLAKSKELWQTLRHVEPRAAGAAVAFAFDASYYPPPPQEIKKTATIAEPEPVKMATPVTPVVDLEAQKQLRVREQARNLVLKTTALGNGTTRPMAIVNQQLLTLGQEILGFEITAIRAREVEFVKEGVTVVVKMPEGQ